VAVDPETRGDPPPLGSRPPGAVLSALPVPLEAEKGEWCPSHLHGCGVWYPLGRRTGQAPPPCRPGAGGEEQVRGVETVKNRLRVFAVHPALPLPGRNGHVKPFLNLYTLWYNHVRDVRDHLTFGRPPIPVSEGDGWRDSKPSPRR